MIAWREFSTDLNLAHLFTSRGEVTADIALALLLIDVLRFRDQLAGNPAVKRAFLQVAIIRH